MKKLALLVGSMLLCLNAFAGVDMAAALKNKLNNPGGSDKTRDGSSVIFYSGQDISHPVIAETNAGLALSGSVG